MSFITAVKNWLPKSVLPKTLWGQLISLLMLGLLVSQAVTLMVFIDNRRTLTNSLAEGQIINRVVEVLNKIEEDKSGDRPSNEFLQQVSDNTLRFSPRKSSAPEINDHPDYTEALKTSILARLINKDTELIIFSQGGKDKEYTSENPPENLIINAEVRPDFWLRIRKAQGKVSYDWMLPLLMTMGLMMIFIIVIISFVVRKLTQPLSALSKSARELGLGRDVEALDETGTEDIREVIRAFNDMNKKIRSFVGDRTKLLAAISHDLRTPITSLLFRAEFIEDKEMQGKIFETLEEMRAITEATLNFSKDSGAEEKTKNTDLKSLLETMVTDYDDMGKPVKLVVADEQKQIILPMRVQSIKRALRNFVDNGIKYGSQVEIEFRADKINVEIYVRDCGEGIEEAEFEQVFEPFYRLEKSRNKDTGGVGLGLSISRGIIRGHGGDVVLANLKQDGKTTGLEVKIILPLK